MHFNYKVFLKVAEQVLPGALTALGVPPAIIPLVTHSIKAAETVDAPGADKKKIALDTVSTGIALVNAAKPGAIDPNVIGVVDEAIDAAVGAVNVIAKRPIHIE